MMAVGEFTDQRVRYFGSTVSRAKYAAARLRISFSSSSCRVFFRELLDRMLILGETHLRAVLAEYQAHYNGARPHQGIAQRIPDAGRDNPPPTVTDLGTRRIRRKPVLDGLINEYMRAA